jgi:hypothetical protein
MLRNVLKGRGEAQQKIGNACQEVFVFCTKRRSKRRHYTRNSLKRLGYILASAVVVSYLIYYMSRVVILLTQKCGSDECENWH